MPTYKGKDLTAFSDWELAQVVYDFEQAEKKREKASKHPKFDKLTDNKAMEFPPPNPEYLKLKSAINQEIEKRKKHA